MEEIMPKTKSSPLFSVGDVVRVKPGVADPDFPDIPFGGWAGTVLTVEKGSPRSYLIALNERTLNSVHSIYFRRCEINGLEPKQVILHENDLESDNGNPIQIEHPSNIVTCPPSMDDQDDRIRAVFKLTSDDLIPESDDESLLAYYQFLAVNLSFPFKAKYSFKTGPYDSKTYSINVLGLLDPGKYPDEHYGLFCQARRGRKLTELPLTEVEVTKKSSNQQIVEDYSSWIVNW